MRKFILLNVIIIFLFSYAGATRFILSSTPDGRGAIYVNDDIKITLEGENYSLVLVDDQNGNPNSIGPIEFEAEEGDVLTIEATDKSEAARMKSGKVPVPNGKKALSSIYLVYKGGGFAIPIFGGLPETNSSWEGEDTFVKITYKIGTLMKLYCLSSDKNSCVPIYVNEDMTLFKFEYGDSYSVEVHPDNDGTDSHILMNIALPVLEEGDETPTYEVEFVNRRKDGELSRVYLVPECGGLPITIVAQPKWIDGDCEKFPECEETLLYSYQGPLNLPVSSGGLSSVIAEFSKTYHENGKEGIWYNLTLTKPSPANIFVYWNVLGEANLFYTSEGYDFKGEAIPIYSDIKGELLLPDYDVFQRLFVSGLYKLGVLAETGDKFEYPLTLKVDEGELSDATDLEGETSFITSSNDLTTTEDYLKEILEGHSYAKSSYYLSIPITAEEFDSGVISKRCYFYPANILKKMSNGFSYRFISEGDAEFIFALWVFCEKVTSTDNGTQEEQIPLNSVVDDITVDVHYTFKDKTITLNLNRGPLDFGERGAVIYNSVYIPMGSDTQEISFYYQGEMKSSGDTFSTKTYSHAVVPPQVVVRSPEGFINGLLLNMNTTPAGTVAVNANFGVDLEPLKENVDFSKYKAEVLIDFDSDGNYDVNLAMTRDSNKFRVSYSMSLSGMESFTYKIYVYDENGKLLGGRFLNQKHTVSVSSSEYIALGISGYSAYVFGDTMKFTLSAVTSVLSDESYDVYLGLYKEGRGIIWMMDPVPGSGIYKTSVEKKPLLLNIDAEVCSSGCSWPFDIQIPDKFDFFAPFYYGKYVWILEFTKHGTDEVVARLYYPFSIKIE